MTASPTLFERLAAPTLTHSVARVGRRSPAPAARDVAARGLELASRHLRSTESLIFPTWDCNEAALVLMRGAADAIGAGAAHEALRLLHEAGELMSSEPQLTPGGPSDGNTASLAALPINSTTALPPIDALRIVREQRAQIITACAVARFLISGAIARTGGL